MKTLYNYFILFIVTVVLTTSCSKRELVTLESDANTTVSLSETSLELTIENADTEALTVSWTEPDFGFDAAPTYKVLIDFAGGDFNNAQSFVAVDALSLSLSVGDLNAKLQALEAEPDVPQDFDIRVLTILSNYSDILSDPATVTLTPYADLLDLSTDWGIVGSATPSGWDAPDIPMYQTGTEGVYVAYAFLNVGEFKFRKNEDWAINYGDDGADGSLDIDGGNIVVDQAGNYKVVLNLNALSYTMELFSWGIVGSATPNGWDGPDIQMNYDPFSNTFKAIATLTDGEIKFRQNNQWEVNYGDTGADGTLEEGGENIAVSAGFYLVTLDFSDSENPVYTIEETDVWGIVGSATPNGWDGPDTKFTPDFGANAGLFYLNNIELTEGEIKFRQNDSWTLNYGATDDTLVQDGPNIVISIAGTYSFVLDFSNPEVPTYTMN